ncbi:MAG: DUF285 domain-containing protein [Treponema sp.]|nr:DUF285 domain-containing protein [Treponema sp.]
MTFEVPAIATGTEVTVALVIKTSGGAVLYAGSKTQVLTGDASSLNISLSRQYWAMPAGIGAAASPDTLEYDPAALDSNGTTFSIIGLDDAPADVSYSWTDESGTVVGTGSSLTLTVGQMLGAGYVPVAESEERTYGVSVSYTDASGTAKTLTASATVTIVTTATIRLTGSGIQSEGGRQFIVIPKTASSVPITAEVLCFGGTPTYSWSNVGVGFTSFVPAGGDSNNIGGPWDGGTSTVTVTADLGDGRLLTKELDVYVLEARISGASLSTSSTSPTIMAEGGSAVNLTASLAGIADLEGAEFTWEVSPAPLDPSKPFLKLTPGGAGNASCSLEPKQAANDTHTLTAKITYRGVEVQAERYIKVAGLRLTGGADVLFLIHSATATNTLSLTLTPVGVTLADLGSTVLFSSDDSSIATASPASTGAGSGGAARSFAASDAPPAVGTTTYELSAAGSAGTCIAWLDGTTIKYYAEGYTDASPAVKIPLDADCEKMFYCCPALTDIDLSGFDARNVTTMVSMFDSCDNLVNLNLSGFDTRNVTTMYRMFSCCDKISSLDLSSFDTRNVTTMYRMFSCCDKIPSLDLSSFDTSNVTSMKSMFSECYVITTFIVSPRFVTTALTGTDRSDMMFNSCSQLQGGNGTTYDSSKTNKEYARIDDAPGTPGYFTGP